MSEKPEYQLRVDGKPVRYYVELYQDLLADWMHECAKYPNAEKQVEIVRIHTDVIYSQYHFHQMRKFCAKAQGGVYEYIRHHHSNDTQR